MQVTLLKRDSNKVFHCEYCKLSKNTYFVDDLWRTGSETSVRPFNPIKPGKGVGKGGGVVGSLFPAANLTLNYFWTTRGMNLKLFLNFTGDYFAERKIEKKKKFKGNIFFYRGYCQKIVVRICRNSFSRRKKYVHV